MVIHGDCLEKLKGLPDGSVDLVCTDPPYGYSFMGKDWDKAVPSVEVWQECLRVLKPGGFAFVMSAPRQDVLSQMIARIGEAGFDTGFTSIYWTYASGFPKAMNIGKAVDKRMGLTRERIEGAGAGTLGNTFPLSNEAISNEAKALDGSYAGFQPKPAVEVIIVAMKPLSEKTYVDQALKNGKGVTWLDDVRIPTDEEITNHSRSAESAVSKGKYGDSKQQETHQTEGQKLGRFPANLLVSDDALNVPSKGASAPVRSGQKGFGGEIYGKYKSGGDDGKSFYSDKEASQSYSRYFDLDAWAKTLPFLIVPKAAKSEKNRGLEGIEERQLTGGGGLTAEVREDGSLETASAGGKYGSIKAKQSNHHPTVKPLKLMSYLITLGSRPGDTVLDPFAGSGTTLVAAKELGREFIGIEREAEYVDIINARLDAARPQEKQMEMEI